MRAVGQEARSVASLARWLGVSWATVMSAVRDFGTPFVDDPGRVEQVSSLGIDETVFGRRPRVAGRALACEPGLVRCRPRLASRLRHLGGAGRRG
jgi:hypothetical protein